MERLVPLLSYSLIGSYVVAVLVLAAVGFWIWRRRTRLSRRLARHEAIRVSIRAAGGRKRQRLLRRCQRENILELAEIVSEQLDAVSQRLHPCLYQRATVAIERTVEELDFDRLYDLHGLLSRRLRGDQMGPALETLLRVGDPKLPPVTGSGQRSLS